MHVREDQIDVSGYRVQWSSELVTHERQKLRLRSIRFFSRALGFDRSGPGGFLCAQDLSVLNRHSCSSAQFDGESKIAIVVPASRLGRHECNCAKYSSRGNDRSNDHPANLDGLYQGKMIRVGCALTEHLLGNLGVHLYHAGPQHDRHAGWSGHVWRVLLSELRGPLHFFRIDVRYGDQLRRSIRVEHVDSTPIGEIRNYEAGERRERVLVIQ